MSEFSDPIPSDDTQHKRAKVKHRTEQVYDDEKAPLELRGMENRLGLCEGIIRGDERFDRVSGLIISRFHPDDEPTAPETHASDKIPTVQEKA